MGEVLRRTPLWARHREAGARLVGFAGWEMPIHFPEGQLREHHAVRSDAGIFDVSHMGRFWVGGAGGPGLVQSIITNDLDRIGPGRLLYTPICLESGGVLDDVTCYRLEDGCLLVANAANRGPVWDWLERHRTPGVDLEDWSDRWAQIAIQGPNAQERLRPFAVEDLDSIGYYHWSRGILSGAPEAIVSRNGYTGEDGFEIYLPPDAALRLWDALRAAGVQPAGLGARDTLRMEMGYCLYGQELNAETTPLEAGIGWTVRLKKGRFIGSEALLQQKKQGLRRTLVGFEALASRMPRAGQAILHEGGEVGQVTSGGPCPSLENRGMGLGFVPPACEKIGTPLEIDVRGTRVEARVVERPFYKNGSHR